MSTKDPNKAKAYINAMSGPFKQDIRLSAKRNCIPTWSLASVVLAEIIDRNAGDYADYLSSYRNTASVGPAQLQLNRAVGHKLVSVSRQDALLSVYTRGIDGLRATPIPGRGLSFYFTDPSKAKAILAAGVEEVTYERLFQPRYAVEAAARELSLLITKILKNPTSPFGQWAFNPNRDKCNCNKLADINFRCKHLNMLAQSGCLYPKALGMSKKLHFIDNDPESGLSRAIDAAYNSPSIIGNKQPLSAQGNAWWDAMTQSDLAANVTTFLKKNKDTGLW